MTENNRRPEDSLDVVCASGGAILGFLLGAMFGLPEIVKDPSTLTIVYAIAGTTATTAAVGVGGWLFGRNFC